MKPEGTLLLKRSQVTALLSLHLRHELYVSVNKWLLGGLSPPFASLALRLSLVTRTNSAFADTRRDAAVRFCLQAQ